MPWLAKPNLLMWSTSGILHMPASDAAPGCHYVLALAKALSGLQARINRHLVSPSGVFPLRLPRYSAAPRRQDARAPAAPPRCSVRAIGRAPGREGVLQYV